MKDRARELLSSQLPDTGGVSLTMAPTLSLNKHALVGWCLLLGAILSLGSCQLQADAFPVGIPFLGFSRRTTGSSDVHVHELSMNNLNDNTGTNNSPWPQQPPLHASPEFQADMHERLWAKSS
ncbi:expressed unknown protein [Seminavis robusta]|uniref:Uncharacterized protein n=1 Tax=Seminavis robusta TaxID=568900 RepID=A0A9N8H7X5_9STRA|nr:expressed unknown protein [Seminavis robusta]|eukprot:Sro77_g042231.1  (123) ;mRNA; f:109765-110133